MIVIHIHILNIYIRICTRYEISSKIPNCWKPFSEPPAFNKTNSWIFLAFLHQSLHSVGLCYTSWHPLTLIHHPDLCRPKQARKDCDTRFVGDQRSPIGCAAKAIDVSTPPRRCLNAWHAIRIHIEFVTHLELTALWSSNLKDLEV